MEIAIGTFALAQRGGTETYAITVAEQLQRLGHDVTIAAEQTGPLADEVDAAGLRVVGGDRELPARPDALLVNDNVSSLRLAARHPDVAQVFVAHSDVYDLQIPPRIAGLVSTVVVLNDRMARHVAALSLDVEIARLRQPIDLTRFAPLGPIRPRARRVLLLGNYLAGGRRDLLMRACGDAGLECEVAGRHGEGGVRGDVLGAIADADIVVAKGRAALEGMACGRATYVYDYNGSDGWVTPERYPLLEADNFGGQAEATAVSSERLAADLAAYRPEMGLANRDLVVANHSARAHAHALVDLLRAAAPGTDAATGPLEELAWLARRVWQAESRADAATVQAQGALGELDAARHERDALAADREALRRQRDAFRATRRYRIARALGGGADALRRRRR